MRSGRRLGRRLPPARSARVLGLELTTPVVLRVLEVLTVAMVFVFLVVTSYAFASARNTFSVVGDRTAAGVAAAQDIQVALADMDADFTDAMLVAGRNDLGTDQRTALDGFRQRESTAFDSVVRATQTLDRGDEGPVRDIVAALPDYQSHVDQALLLQGRQDTPGALDQYRQATTLMQQKLLPAAHTLADRNVGKLDATYADQQQRVSAVSGTVTFVVVLCFVVLLLSQAFLYRRTRRALNLGLLGATLVLVAATVMAGWGLANASTNLKIAKNDAFDSRVTIGRARATLFDMHADESRYLFDVERASTYEADYLRQAQQLVRLSTGSSTITSYAISVAKPAADDPLDRRFDGLLVESMRSYSFPDERAPLAAVFRDYADLQNADASMRAAVGTDRTGATRQLVTSTVVTRVDGSLVNAASVNEREFNDAIDKGRTIATFWQIVLPLVALACMALVLLGFRPRIAEYQRS